MKKTKTPIFLAGICLFLSLPLASIASIPPESAQDKLERLHLFSKNRQADSIKLFSAKWLEESEEMQDHQAHWIRFYYAFGFYEQENERCLNYATQAHDYFESEQLYDGQVRAAFLLGNMSIRKGQQDVALQWFRQCLAVFDQHPTCLPEERHLEFQVKTYNSISNCLESKGEMEEALEYVYKALHFAELAGNPIYLGQAKVSLGNLHQRLGQHKRALVMLKSAHVVFDSIRYEYGAGICLINIGNCYAESDQLDSALIYMQAALKNAEKLGRNSSVAARSISLGAVYLKKGALERAEKLFRQAISICEKDQLHRSHSLAIGNLASLLLRKKENTKAIALLKKSLRLKKQLGERATLPVTYNELHRAYMAENRLEEALEAYRNKMELKDSLLNESTLKITEELHAKYEATKKEKAILELNAQAAQMKQSFQQKLFLLFGTLLILALGGLVLYFYHHQRLTATEKKAIESEQRLLRSQMNPHFTFNALASIQGYLLEDQQGRKGAYYLSKFSRLMRQILEHSREPVISLDEELEALENYLSIQQLRFEHQFNYTIDLEEGMDVEAVWVPPLLIQPAVENAIEHGKVHLQENGQIDISVFREAGKLKVVVRDNGVGRSRARMVNEKHTSISTQIIKDRIQLFEATYKKSFSYAIEELPTGGMKVRFVLPLEEDQSDSSQELVLQPS